MRLLSICAMAVLFAGACGKSEPDTTMTPPPAPIPLVTWVTDLAHDTNDAALPDSVEDKNIEDTEDVAAFDAFLE